MIKKKKKYSVYSGHGSGSFVNLSIGKFIIIQSKLKKYFNIIIFIIMRVLITI